MQCNHEVGYMNGHSSHFPWLNYRCKIECLHSLSFFKSSFLKIKKKSRFSKIMHQLANWGHSAMLHQFLKKKSSFSEKVQGFQKSCINLHTRGIQPCLICFQKESSSSKRFKVFKNQVSICKLGAFSHASFI